ncbi:MAG: insulinase family protein [Firmicutes bacterium]|nr:insulinase family protein [Bacillota bacterium]
MGKVITLKNGLRLVCSPMAGTRSASVGVFVGVGSAHEPKELSGISHFIEHMMFKGTKKRSSYDIAEETESLGVDMNAFTSREITAYYTVSTDEHTEKCMEVLADIFFGSVFSAGEIKKEKGVVLEEISKYEDDPSDLCIDILYQGFFGEGSLGRPVLGTRETVSSFTRKQILDFISAHYTPQNTVISLAGNITEEEAIKLTNKYFGEKFKNTALSAPAPERKFPAVQLSQEQKDIEQAHLVFGFPAYCYNNEMSVASAISANVLGGGMSSRLFRVLREELGIVYEVYASVSEYKTHGMLTVYLGTNPDSLTTAISAVKQILTDIKENGVTEKEFLKGKEQLKTGLVLGSEKSYSIMRASAVRLLLANEEFSLDKAMERINAVTIEKVNKAISQMLIFNEMCAGFVSKTREDIIKIFNEQE